MIEVQHIASSAASNGDGKYVHSEADVRHLVRTLHHAVQVNSIYSLHAAYAMYASPNIIF